MQSFLVALIVFSCSVTARAAALEKGMRGDGRDMVGLLQIKLLGVSYQESLWIHPAR